MHDYSSSGVQDSTTHGISVEHINDTVINLRFPAKEDGYIAIDISSEHSAYPTYQIPGNTMIYQVPLSGNVSCLSLFPQHKDNGILSSNTPVNIFITAKESDDTFATIIAVVVVLISLMGHLTIITSVILYYCKHKSKGGKVQPKSTEKQSPGMSMKINSY